MTCEWGEYIPVSLTYIPYSSQHDGFLPAFIYVISVHTTRQQTTGIHVWICFPVLRYNLPSQNKVGERNVRERKTEILWGTNKYYTFLFASWQRDGTVLWRWICVLRVTWWHGVHGFYLCVFWWNSWGQHKREQYTHRHTHKPLLPKKKITPTELCVFFFPSEY